MISASSAARSSSRVRLTRRSTLPSRSSAIGASLRRTVPRPEFGIAAVGALLLSRLGPDASAAADLLPGFLLAAAGIGAAFVTAATTALSGVRHDQAGLTSGLVNTGHELGSALGVAFVSAVAGASVGGPAGGAAPVGGFDRAFLASAVVAAVAAVAAAWLLPAGRPSADRPAFVH
jgi:hypothetical protein